MKRAWAVLGKLLHPPKRMMNAITGGGVWLAVILIAIYMLLRSRKGKEVTAFEPRGE